MAHDLSILFCFLIVVGLLQDRTFVIAGQPRVPCLFIFGDSLVDNGNNNGLKTAAKANYPPYGIDFPEGVSGRFTNGRTIADIIGHLLGFQKFIPPYATASDEEIITGVNYGSGSAGIREESGSHLGDRISLDKQIHNHQAIISRISQLQNNNTLTDEHLKQCIYISNIGNNDYINNFLVADSYPTSNQYTAEEFAQVLVQQYSQQLRAMYNLGARKIAVFGLGHIGCALAEIARFDTNGKACVEAINVAVNLFNARLKPLVDNLNNELADAKVTFINVTSILAPQGGVEFPNIPCCQVRKDGQCVPNTIPCPNRGLSIYYDGFHPTEIANTVLATRSYTALSPLDASPYDIGSFAQL